MENQPLIQKPTSIFALLKLTLSVFKQFFLQIFCFVAAIHVTSFITIQLIAPNFWFSRILGIICFFVAIAIYAIGAIVVNKVSIQAASGSAIDWDDVRKTVKENFWRFIGTFVLVGFVCSLAFFPSLFSILMTSMIPMGPFFVICIISGLALAILPIIVCLNAALIFPVMFAEKLNCDSSWKRSKDLMKGNRLRLSLGCFLVGLLNLGVYIIAAIAVIIIESDVKSIHLTIEVIKPFGIFFSIMFTTLFYFDVRGRKEPKNVEVKNVEIEILI